jgi:hypothetical protein
MNIINLYNNKPLNLFAHMHDSLKSAGVDFEKSVRMAKTVAPLLEDLSSNERHLEVINSDAPIEDKIISIIMLGFPKNRCLLPVLRDILLSNKESLAIAASISIAQMKDGYNNKLLADILSESYKVSSFESVKKSIKKNISTLGVLEEPRAFSQEQDI